MVRSQFDFGLPLKTLNFYLLRFIKRFEFQFFSPLKKFLFEKVPPLGILFSRKKDPLEKHAFCMEKKFSMGQNKS